MYYIDLIAGDEHAWLGVDGEAHQGPTPDVHRATFASAEEAQRAMVPAGWTAEVVQPKY